MTKFFETLIIDDEWLIRSELKTMLNSFSNIQVVGEASNTNDGIKLIQTLKPNLVFLDIQMPGGSGFDLLDAVDIDFKIIFISAFDQYINRSKKYQAEIYLMKPISIESLTKVINHL